MGDITKAMEKEKEYLSYRMKGEEPFHLVDAVKECGFESLAEYFSTKRELQYSQIKFEYIEKPPLECLNEVFRMLEERVTGVLFVDSDQTFVFNGTANFNEAYCEEHDIPVLALHARAGTIVCTDGDFSIGVCLPLKLEKTSRYFLDGIRRILQNHTEGNVVVDKNDVLVEGKKVLGSAGYAKNGMFMFVAHISFSDKTDLISKICIAEKIGKSVGYIDCLTRTEFKREVAEWLRLF